MKGQYLETPERENQFNAKNLKKRKRKGHFIPKSAVSSEPNIFYNRTPCDKSWTKGYFSIKNKKIESFCDVNMNRVQNESLDTVVYDEKNKILVANQNMSWIFSTSKKKLLLDTTLPDDIMMILPSNKDPNRRGLPIIAQSKRGFVITKLTTNAVKASELDINLMLEIVELMYNSVHKLLNDIKHQATAPQHTVKKTNYVIKINMSNFMKYLCLQYKRNKMITNTPQNNKRQEIVPYSYDRPLVTAQTNCKAFHICIERRCMSFKISICKFNSFSIEFFKMLADLFNSGNMTLKANESKRVPSIFKRDWHIRNVTQGFLLTILLKNCNVASLNVMRKLYFVIITSVTPNLTIELNFKLANGIFMAYNMKTFDHCPFEITCWNENHRKDFYKSPKKNAAVSVFPNGIIQPVPQFPDTADIINDRNSSSSTLKNDATLECDYSDDFSASLFYSESESNDIKSKYSSDSGITIKDSINTLTLSIDDILSNQNLLDLRKACGDANLTKKTHQPDDLCNSASQQSKVWLMKLFNESMTLTGNIGMLNLNHNNLVNESIFEKLSFDEYIEALNGYWRQLKPQTFWKVLFKHLGLSILHTLFSSIVY